MSRLINLLNNRNTSGNSGDPVENCLIWTYTIYLSREISKQIVNIYCFFSRNQTHVLLQLKAIFLKNKF